MDPAPFEHRDPEIEAALRASRPVPGPQFTHQLERQLFSRRRWLPGNRPLLAGAAAATGLAAAVAIVGLAGGGPLDLKGGHEVNAGSNCRTVIVEKQVRTPFVVRDGQGREQIRYRTHAAKRSVKRCR
jgi:hypothetical protein